MYINKTKRNLILAAAIINLFDIIASLVITIIGIVNPEFFAQYFEDYYRFFAFSTNIIFIVISFAVGLIGSILLFYSIREKGKYFRTSRGIYTAGVIIVILTGGTLAWILLLIAAFTPDVIIINDREELRREYREAQKEEILHNRAYEEKKQKIEELKKLRDSGTITEEEYKEKLFELL